MTGKPEPSDACETAGVALVAAVERTLAAEIAPQLSGDARFRTLMAASALRMVLREFANADALAEAAAALGGADQGPLCGAIRAGRHDVDEKLHAALLHDALARTRVSKPEAARE
jgi:hypothetical protein